MNIKNIDINNESPIFIGGSKRGGTTLLRRIINAHSSVTIPPPGWFYHFVYAHLYSYGDLNQEKNILELIKDCLTIPLVKKYWDIPKTAKEILSLLPEKSFRGVLVTFFRLYTQRFNTPIWGSKTPSNVFWFKEIQNVFPKARFILLYRDGRDVSIDQVASSWGPNNLYVACLWWRSYIQAMLFAKNLLNQKNYYEIHYEDLVKEPERVVKGICEFLELEYEPGMLKYYEQNTDNFLKRSFHQKTSKPITADYVGIYKKLPLTDKQLQITVIGDLLKELGYKVENKPRKIGFWEQERYLEEDRYGGLILEGAVQYKNLTKIKRLRRKEKGIWTGEGKFLFMQK